MRDHCADERCTTHEAMLSFKKLLKQLATWDKRAKTWTLKITRQ